MSSINNTLEPILQAGPNQQGFSAAENAELTGQAINTTAANARSAEVLAGSKVGGNTGVTTGGEQQLQAQIASGATQGLSNEENQIGLESAQLGRQNFFSAEQGLAGVAGMENPTAYISGTNAAGSGAFGEATQIQNEKNQEQAQISGAVAGLGLSALTGFSGGTGPFGFLNNKGSGGGNPNPNTTPGGFFTGES